MNDVNSPPHSVMEKKPLAGFKAVRSVEKMGTVSNRRKNVQIPFKKSAIDILKPIAKISSERSDGFLSPRSTFEM
jgi:hypothetical protein